MGARDLFPIPGGEYKLVMVNHSLNNIAQRYIMTYIHLLFDSHLSRRKKSVDRFFPCNKGGYCIKHVMALQGAAP